MDFPIWAIVCAVAGVFALLFAGLILLLIKRRRKSSPSTVDIAQDEKMNLQRKQKKQVAKRQFEQEQQNSKTAVMRSHQQQNNNKQPSIYNVASHYQPINSQQIKVVDNEEDLSEPKTRKMSRMERKQHQDNVKVNLPLPPPSTSLFSDKMELSSEEAMELFDKYMNIDKSSDGEKPSFYASVRRKTGTIRSTVRQSLRRQKSTKSTTPLNQLFGEQQQPSTPSTATSVEAYHNMMNDRPSTTSLTLTPQTSDHATIKPPSPIIPPVAHRQQQQEQNYYNTDTYQEEEEVKIPQALEAAAAAAYSNGKNNNTSMHAARRVIRTASRKSKARSMLVNEEDIMKMFAPSSVAAEYRDNNRSNAANFATICENRTTGSVRRLVRDSIVTDKSATISAVRATTAGNNRSATSTTNAREIAEWWSPEDTNKSPKIQTISSSNNNNNSNGKSNSNKIPPPPRMPGELVDEQKGNVNTIRRMLQASMTESESLTSIVTATRGTISSEGLEGPDPEVSFSSSTARTMIPENDQQQQQQRQQSFVAAGIAAQEKIEIDGTNFAMLQQNRHQTWNGRTNRISNRPSVLPPQQQAAESLCNSINNHITSDDNYNSKSFFNTVNFGRRQSAKRKVTPWMDTEDTKRTLAQRERDHYLQLLYDQA